jgi:group I intron endonuclease
MLAYMIMNKINGKGYVGITTRTLCRRWHEHVNVPHSSAKYLHRAIQKHGSDSFDVYPIASAVGDLSNLKELEKILISQFETFAPNGYNLTLGGDGVFGYKQTAEQAEKSRTLRLGVKHSEETKKKMSCAHSGENNHFFGRRHSEETKKRISEAKKGCVGPWLGKTRSEETKKKISKANKGISKPHTEETKLKISLAQKGRKQAPPSEETRRKLSESVKKSWALRRQNTLTERV